MNITNLWTPTYTRPAEKHYRMTWGEVDGHWCMPRIGVYDWHDGHSTLLLGLVFCTVYINLRKLRAISGIDAGGYGWYFSPDAFVIDWGKKHKFFYYPWSWKQYRHEELAQGWLKNDVVWVTIPRGLPSEKVAKKWTAPYRYTLKNGTIQDRIATYTVERREWRWRWLMWLPWPRLRRTSIWVNFNDEVGERTGSWKGGTLGCGWEMLRGETPEQALRRMERERIFK